MASIRKFEIFAGDDVVDSPNQHHLLVSKSGKFSIEALITARSGKFVYVMKKDGSKLKVERAKLDEKTNKLIDNWKKN